MPKYNIKEKKEKQASYRMLLRPELVDELYEKIMQKIIVEKKYRDPEYSAAQMAEDLGTNSRYISAVINLRFEKNYSSLVNEYRIREAMFLLIDHRYAQATIAEIGSMVGFSNRQSFYSAFFRERGVTPNEYRNQNTPQIKHRSRVEID